MHGWARWGGNALALVGLLLAGVSGAQAASCTVNGGTQHRYCTPAPSVYWRGYVQNQSLPTLEAQVFPDKYSAANAVAEAQKAFCAGCVRGILWAPINVCYLGSYCRHYTDLNPTDHRTEVGTYGVTIWGEVIEFGQPALKTNYFGVVASQGVCPQGQDVLIDRMPNGKDGWFCKPGSNQFHQEMTTSAHSSLDTNPVGLSCTANPINLETRTRTGHEVDWTSDSPYPIVWDRFYNGQIKAWVFGYERRLQAGRDGVAATPKAYAALTRPDGNRLYFTALAPSGVTTSYTWIPDTAKASGIAQIKLIDTKDGAGAITGYVVQTRTDEREHYDPEGRLLFLEDPNGNRITLFRGAAGQLTRIEDDFGHHLDVAHVPVSPLSSTPFSWETGDPLDPNYTTGYDYLTDRAAYESGLQLASVTDGANTVAYTYTRVVNGSGMALWVLDAVAHEDGTTTDYHYGEALTYTRWNATPQSSAPSVFDWTGTTGEDGQRFSTYYYTSGVASGSDHGGSLWRSYLIGNNVYDATGTAFSFTPNSATHKVGGFNSNNPCPGGLCGGSGAGMYSAFYDAYGNPLSVYTPSYNTPHGSTHAATTFTHDGQRGLPLTQTEASGTPLARTTTWTWHPTWRVPLTEVAPMAVSGVSGTRTTTWTRDAAGRALTRTEQPSSGEPARTWTYTWSATGQMLTQSDPLGATWTYTHDPEGRLATATDPMFHTTTVVQTSLRGSPAEWVDPNGLVTEVTYDDRERPLAVRRGTAGTHWETTQMAYLATGLLSSFTSPDGRKTELRYDAAHRLVGVDLKDNGGALLGTVDYTLDTRSLVTAEVWRNAAGTAVQQQGATYNTLHQLATTTGAYVGETTTITPDRRGNPTQVKDPLLHTTKQTTDALGRALVTTDALNRTMTLGYDQADQLTSATDAKGSATTYAYNGFGDPVGLTSPDAGTWIFTVDGKGRRATATDPRGATTTWTYDANDRVTQLVHSDAGVAPGLPGFVPGTETQTFTHDSCTFGVGRLCSVGDAAGTTDYTYDLWGRITSKTVTPTTGPVLSVAYAYDTLGRLGSVTYPSGRTVAVARDNASRPISLAYDGQTVLQGVTYRPVGEEVTGWAWGASPAGTVAFAYNLNGQITQIVDVDTRNHGYDLDGKLTTVGDPLNAAAGQIYGYDALERLTSANLGSYLAPISYLYDFGGNRTSNTNGVGTGPTHTTTWAVAAGSNRVTGVTPPGGPLQPWTLDAQGSLIADGTGKAFGYDAKNRLVAVANGAGTTQYAYDAWGQRVLKTGPAGTEHTFYDESGRLLGVYDATGALIEEMIYLDGWRAVATVREPAGIPTIYPILSDHLGTPRKVLDPGTGTTVWSWDAKEPFGNQPVVAPGGFVFHARFPGQRFDPETGLVHNGFRTYHPGADRYVQSDPLGLGAGWNTFGYVDGGPTGATDPFGLEEVCRPRAFHNAELWGYEYISHTNNCYSYALDRPFALPGERNRIAPVWPQPGEFSGTAFEELTCENISSAAMRDGMTMPAGGSCGCSEHMVYLVISPGVTGQKFPEKDYHWYRQESDGFWTHKRGSFKVFNVDASNKLITSPELANRNYGQVDYSVGCMRLCAPNGGYKK